MSQSLQKSTLDQCCAEVRVPTATRYFLSIGHTIYCTALNYQINLLICLLILHKGHWLMKPIQNNEKLVVLLLFKNLSFSFYKRKWNISVFMGLEHVRRTNKQCKGECRQINFLNKIMKIVQRSPTLGISTIIRSPSPKPTDHDSLKLNMETF